VPHRCPTPSGQRGRIPGRGRSVPRRGVVLTELGEARSQLGRVAVEVVPPGCRKRSRADEDQRPGSLRPCCGEDDGGRAGVSQGEEDGFSEADGVHDGLDLGRSFIQRANLRDRVRQPDPGLVKQEHATERGQLIKEGLEFGPAPEQLDVGDYRPDEDQLDGPVAEYLIRQAEIAALGV
jgi:hypothetical protein